MAQPISKSYIKSLGKSILFSAKTVMAQQVPILADTYDKNKTLFTTGATYTKDFLLKKGKIGDSVLKTPLNNLFKDLEEIKNNAIEDLKSGNIRNFDREMDRFSKEMGFDNFDISWGDDNNIDLDSLEVQESDSFSIVDSIKSSTKAAEIGSNIRTKSILSSIVSSSEHSVKYINSHNTRLQTINMNMMSQMHIDTMKMMNDTNNILLGIFEFNNTKIVESLNKQSAFYDSVLQELKEIKNANINMHNRQEQNADNAEQIFGIGGSIDLAAYGKQIKKNFQNIVSSSPLGMAASMSGMMPGGLLGSIKDSPLSFVMELMMSGMMPKSLKGGMAKLDVSISGLFSALALKINAAKNQFDKPGTSLLAQLFGINVDNKTKIDVSKFHKEAMPYNGRADKAITEVIPLLLSNILSTLSGSNKVALYNYNSGKFTHSGKVIKDYGGRIERYQLSEMDDFKSSMKQSLSGIRGGQGKSMDKELDTFIKFLISTNTFYNPLKDTSASGMQSKGLNLKDVRSYETLRTAFLNMPKSVQNRLARDIIKARGIGSSTARNVESELFSTGLSSAYSDLGDIVAPKGGNKLITPTSLLRDIKSILIDGIIVYGGGNVNVSPTHIGKIMSRKSANRTIIRGKSFSRSGGMSGTFSRGSNNDDIQESLSSMNTMISDSSTNRRSFLQGVISEPSLFKKIQMIKNKLSRPSEFLTGALDKMDSLIYRIIYGRESLGSDSDDPEKANKNSIIGRLASGLNKSVDTSLNWIDTKIISPMHEKFFGENGLFTKFTKVFEPFLDKMKDMSGKGFSRVSKFLMGEKNAFGFYTGGVLADVGNSFVDFSNSVRHFFSGSGYMASDGSTINANVDTSVFSYIKKYSKNMFESIKVGLFFNIEDVLDEEGNIIQKHKGDGLLSGVISQLKNAFKIFDGLFTSKEGETPENIDSSLNQWKKELKGFLPKGIAGAALGIGASLLIPGGPLIGALIGSTVMFASHSNKFREFLFGNDEGRQGILPSSYINIAKAVKNNLSSITAGGVLGIGASLLLPGGPLLGLTIGSAIGFAAKSEKMQEILFGKTDDDGNLVSEGILGPDFKKDMKKYFPSIGAGGIMGMGASLLLPGGPLLGLTIGSAIGFASKSEKVQELLFGKTENGELTTKGLISPEMLKMIKKYAPKGIAGGIAGAISGGLGFLMPGGPIIGALIGSTLSVVTSTDSFKNFLFGDIDPETMKRKGGLLGQVRDFMGKELFDPFKRWRAQKKIAINEWFETVFKQPFLIALEPFKKSMSIIGERFKDSFKELKESFKSAFNSVFEKSVGMPLGELIKTHLTDPMKNMLNRLFTAIGKGLSAILTSPIKFMTTFADTIIDRDREDKKEKGPKPKEKSLFDTFKDYLKNAARTVGNLGYNVTGVDTVYPDYIPPINMSNTNPIYSSPVTEASGSNNTTAGMKGPNIPEPSITDKINTGTNKKQKYGPFIGQINLTKYYSKINSIESHLRKIKDEVFGQLDGVGWNLDYIAGILGDVFGRPSIMPTTFSRRGNRRARFILSSITDLAKSPFKFLGRLTQNLIIKPVIAVFSKFTDILTKSAKTIANTIWNIAKAPIKLANIVFKSIHLVADGLLTVIKSIGPAIGSAVKTAVDVIGTVFKSGASFLSSIFKGFGNILIGLSSATKDIIVGFGQIVKTVIPSLIQGFTDLTSLMGKTMLDIGKFTLGLLGGGIRGAFALLKIPIPKFLKRDIQKVYVVGGKLDNLTHIGPSDMPSVNPNTGTSDSSIVPTTSQNRLSPRGILRSATSSINKALLTISSNFRRPGNQRLGFLSSLVRRSTSASDHEGLSRGMQVEQTAAAIQTADALSEMNRKSGILSKLWEFLKLGFLPALAGFVSAIKSFSFPKVAGDVLEEVAEKGRSILGKISKSKVVGAAVVGAKNLASKIGSAISRILAHPRIVALIGRSTTLTALAARISSVSARAIALQSGTSVARVLTRLNPISGIGLMVYAFTSGIAEVRNIFKVPAGSEPTWAMRLSAGLGKLLSNATFGVITPTYLAVLIYNEISSDADKAELKEQQSKLETETSEYNEKYGKDLTVDQYNEDVNATVWGVTKKIGMKIGRVAKSAYTGVIKPVGESAISLIKGVYGLLRWGFNEVLLPIGKGLWNMAKWGYDKILKPLGQIVVSGLKGLGKVIKWGFNEVLVPIGEGIFKALKWGFTEIIVPIGETIYETGKFLYENALKPLLSIATTGFNGLKDLLGWGFNKLSGALNFLAKYFGEYDGGENKPSDAKDTSGNNLFDTIIKVFSKLLNAAKSFGQSSYAKIKQFGEDPVGTITGEVASTETSPTNPLDAISSPPSLEYGRGSASNITSLKYGKGSNPVKHISQQDPSIVNKRFGKTLDTIGDSGCAPAVAAMAISSVTGRKVEITDLAKIASDKGFKNGYTGTNPAFFKYLQNLYDIRVTEISGRNKVQNIMTALKNNKLIILLGGGPNQTIQPGSPFSSVPHYVLATGYNSRRNMIYINDPLSRVGNETYGLFATITNTTKAFVVESKSLIGIQSFKLDASAMSGPISGFGIGGKTDDQLRKEYGYALNYPGSDMTVNDLRMIESLTSQYKVNPHFWLSLVQNESSYNSKATPPRSANSSARGWGQVLDFTGKWLYQDKLRLGKYNHDMAFNKETNARMSIYYISQLIKERGGIAGGLNGYYGHSDPNELTRYRNVIAKNLKNNTGLSFNDVSDYTTGSSGSYDTSDYDNQTSSASSQTTPEKVKKPVRNLSTVLASLGGVIGQEIKDTYGMDTTGMFQSLENVSSTVVDPFYDPGDSNESSFGTGALSVPASFLSGYGTGPSVNTSQNSIISGAPSASVYASKVSEANANLNSTAYATTHSSEMIRLLTIIARGVESLVDISAETKASLNSYLSNISNKSGGGSSVIISQKPSETKGGVNPFIDSGVKKRDKTRSITAVASGISV